MTESKLNFSKLMLGTVQFGLNYGIANTRGKPSLDTVMAILNEAWLGGVNALDTAAAYGDSETVLGEALTRLGLIDKMLIVSKVSPIPAGMPFCQAEKFIETSICNSLRNLRIERLPVCLFHRDEDLKYYPILKKMTERGLIGAGGISLDEHSAIEGAIARTKYIQIPYNVLEWRYETLLEQAVQKGITIFARSVYLQGLLLMDEASIRPGLCGIIPVRRRLEELARRHDMSLAGLCLRFVLSRTGISSVLTGVDNPAQLRENLTLIKAGQLPTALIEEIRLIVPKLPEELIHPKLWSKTV
jgi:aryl-alcohol dehydrogenase-like predicted oxidoreductase